MFDFFSLNAHFGSAVPLGKERKSKKKKCRASQTQRPALQLPFVPFPQLTLLLCGA